MPAEPAYVIVGASLAGAKAAETLREEGFAGAVVLIGTEQQRPYERPPLSKGYLLGKDEPGIDLRARDGLVRRARRRPAARRDRDVDRPGRPPGQPGGRRVRVLRPAADHHRRVAAPARTCPAPTSTACCTCARSGTRSGWRAALRGGGQVVIAGAGWIGLETAAAAREYGCEVTVVEPEPGAAPARSAPSSARSSPDLHRSHGVTFRFGEGLSELTGLRRARSPAWSRPPARNCPPTSSSSRSAWCRTSALAAEAGLDVDNGIVVDEALRTSDPDIFAAGDVANAFNPLLGRRIRVEHWGNALAGGPVAARSMLGQDVSYDRVPYFFSDQYDLGMETAGLPEPGHLRRGRLPGRQGLPGVHLVLAGRRGVVAGMNVNVWDVNDDIQALIRSGATGRPGPPGRPRHPPHRPLARTAPASARSLRAGTPAAARDRRAGRAVMVPRLAGRSAATRRTPAPAVDNDGRQDRMWMSRSSCRRRLGEASAVAAITARVTAATGRGSRPAPGRCRRGRAGRRAPRRRPGPPP